MKKTFKFKIAMIGASSPGFSMAVAEELVRSEILREATFVLMDVDAKRLKVSEHNIRALVAREKSPLHVESTLDRRRALDGAKYVVTSCEKSRVPFWIKDIEIPRRCGVEQTIGENGGPGGQAHAMRSPKSRRVAEPLQPGPECRMPSPRFRSRCSPA